MGFFKKLFRRKSSNPNDSPTNDGSPTVSSNNNKWKGKRAAKKQQQKISREDSPTQQLADDVGFIPPSTNSHQSLRGGTVVRGPDLSDGTQRPVLSARNIATAAAAATTTTITQFKVPSSPVDLDDSRSESASYSRSNSHEEKKADDENAIQEVVSSAAASASRNRGPQFGMHETQPPSANPVFTMPDSLQPKLRFSAGHVSVDDDTDGESSSFNLSTDAEDTEYEAMRRRLGGTAAADLSVTNYTTDGETSVFPGLPSEDDATTTTASVTREASQQSILHLPTVNPATGASLVPVNAYVGTTGFPGAPADRYPVVGSIASQQETNKRLSKPPQDDNRFSKPQDDNGFASFTNSSVDEGDDKIDVPRRSSSGLALPKNDSPERKRSPRVVKPPATNSSFGQYNDHFMESVYGSPSNTQEQRRSFVSPKKQVEPATSPLSFEPFASENKPFESHSFGAAASTKDNDLFADFADFSSIFPADDAFQLPAPEPEPMNDRRDFVEGERPGSSRSRGLRPVAPSTSTSAVHNETSLSELLAQAKSKSSRGGSHSKKTSSSVNSAPAMTASYLRQHHNLGRSRNRDGTSVTDIIQSLEAANATRATGSSSRSMGGSRHSRDDGLSAHSHDGASVLSAKERIRRRRERRHQRDAGEYSSDSGDEHEDNESWLFDEVTGALGPRGIAADLESLSGRSNRSNSSRGNRSHKSHRSHRSHKSGSRPSRRRPKSGSGDSVESRQSKDSRRSRGSRYSHRSTRSYISQMSEQSRSVANDLLRLEMQLAMVGSGGAGGGVEDRSTSVGGRSRTSRTAVPAPATSGRRTATARRSRITVHAPAGKLGIILANKADSKGTVVSGVRTSSALAEKISPGDRIVAIDGEDVSLMTVSEITTIMARKADFDRTLTVLTTPRHADTNTNSSMGSPRSGDSFHRRSNFRG